MNIGDLSFIVLSVVLVLGLCAVGLLLFVRHFQRTLITVYEEKKDRELHFLHEINHARNEIQDKTLTYIGRELHDNIGQLLTVSNIQAMALMQQLPNDKKLLSLQDALQQAIVELKALSKSLDSSRLKNFGLHHELKNEVNRLLKLDVLNVRLDITGEERLDANRAVLVFRIIQEFMNNSLKYSKASELNIVLRYTELTLCLELSDNGIGFNMQAYSNSSGILSMRSRLGLLNAEQVIFESSPTGTNLKAIIPIAS